MLRRIILFLVTLGLAFGPVMMPSATASTQTPGAAAELSAGKHCSPDQSDHMGSQQVKDCVAMCSAIPGQSGRLVEPVGFTPSIYYLARDYSGAIPALELPTPPPRGA